MPNNIKFQEPLFPRQSLANGFLYGFLELKEDTPASIKLDNGYNMPISVSKKVLAKAQLKGIDLSIECFCGVYPKTFDGMLTAEISTIYQPEEFSQAFLDKFRVRGEILSAGVQSIEVLIETKQRYRFVVHLLIQQGNTLSNGQFIEAHASRIFNKLVVYEYQIL
jgi:hypothetical protein